LEFTGPRGKERAYEKRRVIKEQLHQGKVVTGKGEGLREAEETRDQAWVTQLAQLVSLPSKSRKRASGKKEKKEKLPLKGYEEGGDQQGRGKTESVSRT